MTSWLKTLIVVALVVPMTAYVAGSLASSRSYDPAERSPVIIQDRQHLDDGSPDRGTKDRGTKDRAPSDPATTEPDPTSVPTPTSTSTSTSTPTPTPTPRPARSPTRTPGSSRPSGTTSSQPGDVDDNGVRVVTPQPTSVDDGDDDDDGSDESDDDADGDDQPEGDDDDDGSDD